MPSASITEWLDDVKAGYGDRFASCFDGIGVEDVADVEKNLGTASTLAELEEGLRKAGAKTVHIQNIKTAIAELATPVAMPHAPDGPASSGTSPLKARVAVKGGKQFGCFLSHHKASCAMEARFLKEKFEGLLSKEVFLDSDDLRGECNHSNSCDAEDTTH